MIVLVDGPSGSGKTTLATRLGTLLRLPVIHMDDFYPGWSGLAAGSDIIATSVLKPADPGYYRWDWANDRAGEWVLVPPGAKIIEGAGAVTGATLRAASISDPRVAAIMLTGEITTRYRRAMRRDPYYEPYWEMWAEQEQHHYAAQPTDLGGLIPTLRIDTTGLDAGQVVRRAYDFITYYVE